jgi:hypothetical protein
MKKVSRVASREQKQEITIGLDLGDRFSHYCMLNSDGDAIESGRIQTTEEALRRHFEGEPTISFALECGTHSPWISRLLEQLGHQVIVANARKIRALTASESKNDKNDAEKLARFAFWVRRLVRILMTRSSIRQYDDHDVPHVDYGRLTAWGTHFAYPVIKMTDPIFYAFPLAVPEGQPRAECPGDVVRPYEDQLCWGLHD